jgi:type VI secretion system protein ImpL
MKFFSRKICFFFLFLLVVFFAGVFSWWGIKIYEWPIWLGAAMGAGIVAFFLFILFLKNYLVRRRGKKLIEHIVEQGQVINEEVLPDLLHVKELDKSWNANLALLRGSHLRSKGNPVYVLPWYLAMGATGVGKTTALDNSGLAASFTEVGQDSRTRGTRNCDWWFFDKAVILDTAGRYAIPVEGTADQDEWKHFLNLLAKHRKKEPLNGILLFFAADTLTSAAADLLKKQGQFLRNRIDNLMRAIGYKIPVRVIVTKMDLVPGFSGFAGSFEPAKRKQAMGYWNRKANPFWQEVLDDAMREIGDRLRELRKEHVLAEGRSEPDFLILPKNFEELHIGLKNILEPVFSENRFQETPYLAGAYFGSGRCSDAANASNAVLNHKNNSGKQQAVFFTDIFSQILADGRERLEPVKEFLLWRRVTNNLSLLAWWLFCFFCAGLIGRSFTHNHKSLVQAGMIQVPSQELITKDSNAVILGLESLRLKIIKLEELNNYRKISPAGFPQEDRAEKKLKAHYCKLFELSLQQPMESGLARALNMVDKNTSNTLIADYAGFTVEYINQIQSYLTGEQIPEVSQEFNPAAARILQLEDAATSSEVAACFADQNKSYLLWSENKTGALSRLKTLQSNLVKLLASRIDDTSWLYDRLITKTPSIKLGDFWHHNIPIEYDQDGKFSVLGAFTEKGRQEIYKFLAMAENAGDKDLVKKLRSRFNESYQSQFFSRWYTFAENFQMGRTTLHQGTDWRETAIRMTSAFNPYFALIATMAEEFNSYSRKKAKPAWAEAITSFDEIRKAALARRQAEEKSVSSITTRVKRAGERLINIASKLNTDQTDFLHLVSAWDAYEKALTALEAATPYKEKTFQIVSNWFRESVNPTSGEETSLYGKAYQALGTVHGLAKGKYDNSLAWRFVEGPFDFLTEFGLRESAAVLQERWLEQIVAQAETIDKDKLLNFLFEKDSGAVWRFVKSNADPFLKNTIHGYQSRDIFGRSLFFEPALYTFLDQGAAVVINRQADYRVAISNRPMLVNRAAVEEPYSSVITVQCADDEIVLENDNYPRTQNFTWSPDKCGDVNLTIEFPSVTLHKTYSGKMAFANFLSNLVDGTLRFAATDFPDEKGHLSNLNIKSIILTYAVTGQEPVLRLLELKPIVPKVIALPEQQHGEAVFN